MAVAAVTVIAGSLLPWVRSGSRDRHSYDLFALVDRLGFSPDGLVGSAIRLWPLVPLLTIGAMVLAWWGWRRVGGVVGIGTGLYAGGVGWAIATAPAVIEIRPGAAVTAAGGAVMVAASALTVLVSPPGRSVPTRPDRPAPHAGSRAGRS
ncbi:MAG: hypothetical protein ACK5OX_01235 [Desertimonas sp.]